MSSVFYSDEDRRRAYAAQVGGYSGAEERRQQGLALRRQHDQANAALRRLPFPWQPVIKRPKYTGERFWEQSLPAVHIMLQQPYELRHGRPPVQQRAAGDWLCMAAVDFESGELRYESDPAPQWADGSGGPAALYDQQPTCKNCLRWAQHLLHG